MSDIENIFKEKLTNHEVEVSEGLWLSVANGLEKKKRRRVFFIALSAVVAVMFLLAGIYYIIGNNQKTELNSEDNQIVGVNLTTKGQMSDSNSNFNSNKENSKDNSSNVGTNSLEEKHLNSSSEVAIKINRSKKENPAEVITVYNDKIDYETLDNTEKTDFNLAEASYKDIKTAVANNKIVRNDGGVVEVEGIKNVISIDKKQRAIKCQGNICSTLSGKCGVRALEAPIVEIPFRLPISTGSGQLNTCSTINTNHFFVGMYFSPDFYSKNLYGEDKDYRLLRHHSEKSKFSMSAGLDIGYTFKNGALIKTGFRYSQINEQFHHREIEKIQTIITIDTIIDNGSMKIVRDTTRKIVYGDNIEKPISFKLYDIPLIFGLQYGLTDNQKLGMNIGMIFNIALINKGYIFNKDQEIVEFNSKFTNQSIFKTNVGISIYSSFSYSYVINKNIDIFVEPKAIFHLNSFTKSGYPLGQKYNTFGLSFGTVYHFPKVGGS